MRHHFLPIAQCVLILQAALAYGASEDVMAARFRSIAISDSWPLFVLSGKRSRTGGMESLTLRRFDSSGSTASWEIRGLARTNEWLTGFVADDGWVAGVLPSKELVLLDPRGNAVSRVDIGAFVATRPLPATQWESELTAESCWSAWQASHMYFLDWNGQHLFCVRNMKGDRLVVERVSGRRISPVPEQLMMHLADIEERFVVQTLTFWEIEYRKWAQVRGCMHLHMAVLIAGQAKMTSALPLLGNLERDLEDCSFSYWGSSGLFVSNASGDPVASVSAVSRRLRRLSAWSLRQLGQTPQGYPGISFRLDWREGDKKLSKEIPPEGVPVQRSAGLWSPPKMGMTALGVIRRCGSPDMVIGDGTMWVYDMDHPTRQVSVEFVAPPGTEGQVVSPNGKAWRVGRVRDVEEGVFPVSVRLNDIFDR